VESLLIEKPSNPIAFIIDYLIKTYPEQAKVAVGLDKVIGAISATNNNSPKQQEETLSSTLPL